MIYYTFDVKNSNNEIVSKVKIETEKLIEVYDDEIEIYHKYCKKLPQDAPRHIEYQNINRLRKLLLAAEKDIDFAEKNEYVQSFSIKVMIRKDFHSIFCKICSKEYSPEEIIYETWYRGESLFASGGKTLLCENNHFLFGYMEWNS
ncbi:hypothetical protein [Chryseobacterium sp. HMWF035]|uniref:hypothetical protein n=1 Tax=Chryseobacterium sp. HMWF035 TaxID=2056868 RepID=UPI000D57B247|nr:hypothetical protein [Chryseobacterium sp. HMWF035]PVV57794.1 hypothetical protein DD829_08375 [Chryseobacterium sp. HMWF035]